MSLWKIAWRSIQQRALASALTAFAMGLGVALVVAVLVIHGVIDQSFKRGAQGYDLIVGAKGESIQLVLNTVFHLGQAPEVIPYSYFKEFNEGQYMSAVETAIPVAMGHGYNGYPVIATTPAMFDRLKYMGDRDYEFEEGGRNFKLSEPFEAVIGSTVAKKLKMKVGDTFRPTHPGKDIEGTSEENHHEPVKVVGILKHTGTPNDQGIFMNLEGFYRFGCHQGGPSRVEQVLAGKSEHQSDGSESGDAKHSGDEKPSEGADGLVLPGREAHGSEAKGGHQESSEPMEEGESQDHEETAHGDHETAAGHEQGDHSQCDHGPISDEDRKLSAILVCTDHSRPKLAMALPTVINEQPDAQAVAPTEVIARLFEGIIGNIQLILLILAVLVVVVAGIGILVSIYNSMSDRRHEIAVMRALGASRVLVGTVILLESILLSLGGGVFGLLLGHALVGLLAPTIAENTGVIVSAFQFQWDELILIPGLIFLASLVGYVPAAVAYRTDVAKSLTANQ